MPQQSNESSATKWHFVSKLSGSENHKGFSLYDNLGDRVGEIYPLDQDGIEGEEVATKIIAALNAYDENQATIKDLQERLEKQGKVIKDLETSRAKIVHQLKNGLISQNWKVER